MSKHKQSTIYLYKRLLTYVKPYWPIFAIGIFTNMLYSGLDAGFTYSLKPLMDKGFIARDLVFIKWVPFIALFAITLRGVTSFIASYCMTYVARGVVMRFRQQMFKHMLKLPARYYDNATSGQLLSKLLYDVEQLAQVSTDALTTFVQSSCFVLGLFIVMFSISWRLTLLYLITVPVIAVIVKYTNKRIRRVSLGVQKSMGEVTEIAEESIEGYRVVRTFGGESYEKNKFDNATEISRQRDMKVAMTKGYNVSGVLFIAACGISFIIYLAISPSSATMLTAGSFASLIAAMLALLKPLKNLATVNSTIQRGLAGAQSIFEFLDKELEADAGEKTLHRAQGAICFDNVNFAYHSGRAGPILQNINFSIAPGETVALVGRSGSGKSTLAALLSRFYEIEIGTITLDGINIQQLTLTNLREQIALVNQNVVLFNDTIANNIAYGRFDKVTAAEIEQAAIAAHAMDFIKELPDGLNTLVGENGVLLSGGQRQRLAIARAILKDAPVLILDEATSALDTESERHIQAALDKVMQDRTTLVIAHRLSTIENADKIMVLDAGKIMEVGTHTELLARNGHYARLYALQFGDARSEAQTAADKVA